MSRENGIEALAAPGVRELAPYVPGKPFDELEREYGITDSIKLASNENPHGTPPGAVDAIRRGAGHANWYPDGAGFALKRALAARLSVSPEQITLGNGSNDVLVLLAETFLTPQTNAVYDQYSFVVYRLAVQAAGAGARVAPSTRPDAPLPFAHDLAAMRGRIDAATRMVFIANPNNPTGTWSSSHALHEFVATVPAHVIVVVDEAYREYVDDAQGGDTLQWIAAFPNLVVTRTFSKVYGLAGLRVGYCVSHASIAELMNRVRQPFNVNSLGQAAALAALEDERFVAHSREVNAAERARLVTGLADLGFSTVPSAGNFVLVNMGEPATRYYERLLRRGIIVRPVANYGLPDHLRITVGLPEQNRRLLSELAAIDAGAGPVR